MIDKCVPNLLENPLKFTFPFPKIDWYKFYRSGKSGKSVQVNKSLHGTYHDLYIYIYETVESYIVALCKMDGQAISQINSRSAKLI